jgi:hypothetical protein
VLSATCAEPDTKEFEAAMEMLKKQGKTTGFVHDRKSGTTVRYTTPFTRKSGDANTSSGNSLVNIAATYDVYK